jgi:glutathione S-transferase
VATVTLWHIGISHYSEKIRWALDFKGIEHQRKAPPPPSQMVVAPLLTRGRQVTFPVLQLDGRTIGDSTAIIAALEERFPDPPLYPEDPSARQRALALEDWFDEHVGPQMRVVYFHELRKDAERLGRFMATITPGPVPTSVGVGFARFFTNLRYRVADEDRATASREAVVAALDRIEEELGDGDHLVGDRFTVADLTAASLLYPLVGPLGAPHMEFPEAYEAFCASVRDRRGVRWIEETYRRHRTSASRATRRPSATPSVPSTGK